jgi:hypothetical protein
MTASLFKVNKIENSYKAGLTPEIAPYLQRMAWAAVQSFKM